MEFAELALLLSWSIPLILLVGICVGITRHKNLSRAAKFLFGYLLIAFLFDGVNRLVGFIIVKNNLILIPLYGVVELTLFTIMYSQVFIRKFRYFLLFLGISGIIFTLYETYSVYSVAANDFQSYSRVIDAFIIVVFTMMYFFEKLSVGTNPREYKLSINTGILIFYSLSLVFLLPINFLINESSDLKFYFWIGYIILTNLFYAFLTFAIWKDGRTQRP